jgi:hypothetical protein
MAKWSTRAQTTGAELMAKAMVLCTLYRIGFHAGKQKLLRDTVASLRDYSKPYQIPERSPELKVYCSRFGGRSNSWTCSDIQMQRFMFIASILSIFVRRKLRITGTPKLLSKNLQVTRAFGGKGVVVHVGKSTVSSPWVRLWRICELRSASA